MPAQKPLAAVAVALLVAMAGVPTTALAQQDTYAGTHVSFETTSNAVLDYGVDGQTMLESVEVQSREQVQSQAGLSLGAEASAITDVAGAQLSVSAESDTSTSMETESGARLTANDDPHGILVVEAGGQGQFVGINVSEESSVESDGENRIVVTNDDGTKGTIILVGSGDLAVNDEGNVTAELDSDSRLVVRSYPDGRDTEDETQEELIANGSAASEVYLTQESDGSVATDVVQYDQNTTVDVTHRAAERVQMTVDRSEHDGKVIITSVSEAALESTGDLSVTVDGEAAVEASSYSELQAAANGGESSKYMVRQASSAQANAEVLVAVNHFSERQITMQSAESSTTTADSTTSDSTDETTTAGDGGSDSSTTSDSSQRTTSDSSSSASSTTSTSTPGFGIGVSLVALLAAVGLRRRS